MPKLDFDWDIMKQYNDDWVLVYEWWYSQYEWEVVWLWVAVCKSWKWREYYDNWYLKYEWGFKNWKHNWHGVRYYSMDWSILFEWEYKDWYFLHWKQYNPSYPIVYDWDFTWDNTRDWKWKLIDDWVLYYEWDFKNHMPHGKWKLYDDWVLAYDWDFVEWRREWKWKYYIDWKLVYDWEWKDWIPLDPWEWYNKEDEDKRYIDNLRWRFWANASVLKEVRKGSL